MPWGPPPKPCPNLLSPGGGVEMAADGAGVGHPGRGAQPACVHGCLCGFSGHPHGSLGQAWRPPGTDPLKILLSSLGDDLYR